jgi:predicted Zn-dependent protease with MMP-like domain
MTSHSRSHRSRSEFEELVRQAVESLPDEFFSRLSNVDITVERAPSRAQLLQQGIPEDGLLLGLYEGVPLTSRENYGFNLPDKITIFQESLEESCDSPDEIVQEVRDTVMHEIAHHFGIDDETLHSLGI